MTSAFCLILDRSQKSEDSWSVETTISNNRHKVAGASTPLLSILCEKKGTGAKIVSPSCAPPSPSFSIPSCTSLAYIASKTTGIQADECSGDWSYLTTMSPCHVCSYLSATPITLWVNVKPSFQGREANGAITRYALHPFTIPSKMPRATRYAFFCCVWPSLKKNCSMFWSAKNQA
jgi:hypothetical protein